MKRCFEEETNSLNASPNEERATYYSLYRFKGGPSLCS